MTSELWNDLTGMDRVHAILSAQLLKRTKSAQSKPRIRRGTNESLEAYARRKKNLKWGIPFAHQEDHTPYTFDPLPPMKAQHL